MESYRFSILSGWLFGRLARKYHRKRWVFFIIGVAIFFLGLSIGFELENLILKYIRPQEHGYSMSGLFRLPAAILLSATSYYILKTNWLKHSRAE